MQKGFTIIELVISIFLLAMAIVGIFSAFSIVTILTSDSSDRLTAAYLAQEGIEIARNIRDQNWLRMDACAANNDDLTCNPWPKWNDGLNNIVNCTNGCHADYASPSMLGGLGDYLNIDTNGFYSQTPATQTKFKRKITIVHPRDADNNLVDHILKVVVEVAWNQKATILNVGHSPEDYFDLINKSNGVTVEETLYDWYKVPSSDKAIRTFIFDELDPEVTGNIVENIHEITLDVPSGTDITNLAPAIEISPGASVSPASGVGQNFTDGVSFPYTVTAEDGTTQTYNVTVNVATQ